MGIQALIGTGPLEAIDGYGYAEQGVEVCFPQAGELLSRMCAMPRAMLPPEQRP